MESPECCDVHTLTNTSSSQFQVTYFTNRLHRLTPIQTHSNTHRQMYTTGSYFMQCAYFDTRGIPDWIKLTMYLGCNASSCGGKVYSHLTNFMLTNSSLGGYLVGWLSVVTELSMYDAFLILVAIPLQLFVFQKSLKRWWYLLLYREELIQQKPCKWQDFLDW